MIENFIYKKESNPDFFWYESGKISLREYQQNLLLYWSGEEIQAEYAMYDSTPEYTTLPTIHSNGKFGSFSKIKSPIVFNEKNLESLTDNLSLSFCISTNSANGFYTYYLKPKQDFEFTPGDYSVNIQLDREYPKQLRFNNSSFGSLKTLKNKLSFELDPSFGIELDLAQSTDDCIAIKCLSKNTSFKLSEGTDGKDLMSLFDVEMISFGTIPTKNTDIVSLIGETSSLKIAHVISETDNRQTSKLRFTLSSGETTKTTSIDWNNNGLDFDDVEVDIDSSVMYIFLNGELKKAVLISPIVKTQEPMSLVLNGTEDDFYSIEEVILKSKLSHKENFVPATTQLTKYNTSIPYIDFHYSGKNIFKNSCENLVINGSDGISCVLNYKGSFYYYSSGAWRYSDGSFSQSNDQYTLSGYINEFEFDGSDDVFIRCYFESNGTDEQYISDIYFTVLDDNILDDPFIPAILVGEPSFEETQEIELNGLNLTIKTDKGISEIDFTENYKIDDLINFLKSNYPEGISKIYKDELSRIVLISDTRGSNAYITVSGTASDILFGKNKSEQGKNPEKDDLENAYDKFIEELKVYATNDLMPIEINDDQIRMFLKEAISIYKKYRSDDYNSYRAHLIGSPEEGYAIPPVIEDHHDISEILFKPLFPLGFYTGNSFGNSEDLLSLALVNSLNFGGSNAMFGKGFATDYYISLMSISNFEQTTGIKPSWKIYNNRLFIFPNSITKYLDVQIIYKAPIDPIKALRDPYIIQYVLGKIRMAQGEVRSQYGSNLSTGGLSVQFNGDTMFERGKEMVSSAVEEMKKTQEPLGFFFA